MKHTCDEKYVKTELLCVRFHGHLTFDLRCEVEQKKLASMWIEMELS